MDEGVAVLVSASPKGCPTCRSVATRSAISTCTWIHCSMRSARPRPTSCGSTCARRPYVAPARRSVRRGSNRGIAESGRAGLPADTVRPRRCSGRLLLGSPTLQYLPALTPGEEGGDGAGDPIVLSTHPALSGDMHRRIRFRHWVAFAGDALGRLRHGPISHGVDSCVRTSEDEGRATRGRLVQATKMQNGCPERSARTERLVRVVRSVEQQRRSTAGRPR